MPVSLERLRAHAGSKWTKRALAHVASRGPAVEKRSTAAAPEATYLATSDLQSTRVGTVRAVCRDALSRPLAPPRRTSPWPNKVNPSPPPQTPPPRASGLFAGA